MSSEPRQTTFNQTLDCRIRVSDTLCSVNQWIHGIAIAIVVALGLHRPALICLAPVIGLSFRYCRRTLRLERAGSIRRLQWLADQTWIWRLSNGRYVDGTLADAMVLGRFFVLLKLRPEGRPWFRRNAVVPLAADSLPIDVHRRLRARLTLWNPQSARLPVAAALRHRWACVRAWAIRGST